MAEQSHFPLYPAAILLPLFSVVSIILEIPPLVWHLRNRNFGATCLIIWLFSIQLMNVINPLIWPRDNFFEWWDGQGLCDIEIRIQVAATVGIPGSITCIVRRLAYILNTDKSALSKPLSGKLQKILDIFLSIGLPTIIMLLYHIVQNNRYSILAITGCNWPLDHSWPSIVLVSVWPLVISTINAYFAGLVLYRLLKYRRDFSRIMTNSSTTQSRFLRLLFISVVIIVAVLPQTIYALWAQVQPGFLPFRWNLIHYVEWSIVKFPTRGRIFVWTGPAAAICGLFVFIAFGLGKDAVLMYKQWLDRIGLGWLCECFTPRRQSYGSRSSSLLSMASRARLMSFKSNRDRASEASASGKAPPYRIPTMDFGSSTKKEVSMVLPVYEK